MLSVIVKRIFFVFYFFVSGYMWNEVMNIFLFSFFFDLYIFEIVDRVGCIVEKIYFWVICRLGDLYRLILWF